VAVKAPAVSGVSEGGVLWGTGSCAACVLWVYARFPHAALDNPAWSAVIALSRHIYPQPAHVVHGVLLHLIPMSWSWTHFKLLFLSSLWSRCAPHPDCIVLFFPERTSSEDWCDTYPHTDVSTQSMSPSPCLLHGVDFRASTLPHSALRSPALLSICVHGVGGGGKRVGSRSGTLLSQLPTKHPHAT
jgi:hypothetical protein